MASAEEGRPRKRPKQRDIEGLERRIYRRMCPSTKLWINATENAKPKFVDSILLRYARRIGFEPSNTITATDIVNDPATRSTYLNSFASRNLSISMVTYVGQLECFMLELLPNKEWTKWLKEVKAQLDRLDNRSLDIGDVRSANTNDTSVRAENKRKCWIMPDEMTVIGWCDFLHGPTDREYDFNGVKLMGRNNNWGSLHLKLAAISSISKVFGGSELNRQSGLLSPKIAEWQTGHYQSKKSAPAFDMCDVELLHRACMENPHKTPRIKKRLWVQVMLQICGVMRASCGTTHCPLIKSVRFPPNVDGYGRSNMPTWVEMDWLDWKGRNRSFKDQPYPIRFHHNNIAGKAHLDIVYLVMDWLDYLVENGEYELEAPLFKDTSSNYQSHVKDMFDYMYELTEDEKWLDYSSHSLRYSAARWARQCGADLNVVKRVGRWVNLLILLDYLGEGETDVRVGPDGIDPIAHVLTFDTVASGTTIAREFPDEPLVGPTGR